MQERLNQLAQSSGACSTASANFSNSCAAADLSTRPEGVRVISETTAKTLTEMLIGVTQEGGTAESASINGYLVAGKTGTTEILTEDGTVASFVGFTPARDPAIAVAVIVYRPRDTYG